MTAVCSSFLVECSRCDSSGEALRKKSASTIETGFVGIERGDARRSWSR